MSRTKWAPNHQEGTDGGRRQERLALTTASLVRLRLSWNLRYRHRAYPLSKRIWIFAAWAS